MKIVALFLSVFVLITLIIDFIEKDTVNAAVKGDITSKVFNKPTRLNDSLLAVEEQWLVLKTKPLINESDITKSQKDTDKSLLIGGEEYVLYGIFSENKSPFILLKGKDESFVKLAEGELLSENYLLNSISQNKILFTHGDEQIEFKLFERKTHADN